MHLHMGSDRAPEAPGFQMTFKEDKYMTKRFPLALAILSCSAVLAPAQDFNLKPGLWAFTFTPETKGDPTAMLSAADRTELETRAHMSPEMRARMDVVLKQILAASTKPIIDRKCITKEALRKLLANLSAGGYEANCKFTVVRSTATALEGREVCSLGGMSSNAVVRYESPNPEALTGRVEKTISGGGGVLEMVINTNGKWLGPSCGDIKP
jgi:hypothetical protein